MEIEKNKNVCAIVTIYKQNAYFLENLKEIAKQVDFVFIINNNSFHMVSDFFCGTYTNAMVFDNLNKNGISGALNLGLSLALKYNFDFFVTFDQDSVPSLNMIDSLLFLLKKYDLVSIGPNYSNYRRHMINNDLLLPTFLITSGNLCITKIINNIGGFSNYLFIDSVDFDLCLRINENKYKFAMAKSVFMNHTIGIEITRYLGPFKKHIYFHDCDRQYYIFRNLFFLKYKYKNNMLLEIKILRMIFSKKIEILFFYPHKDKKIILKNMNKYKRDGRKLYESVVLCH